MLMKITMRWYGSDDPVKIEYIRQVPVVTGIVSALYDVPIGETWSLEKIKHLQAQIEAHGLSLDVIESIPVHDAIKLGLPERDRYIEAYGESIRNMGRAGVGVLCYNFMPVFDWMRTNLAMPMADDATTLSFIQAELNHFRLDTETVSLPGWATAYTPRQLVDLIGNYRAIGAEALFQNLVYFLNAVMPIAEEANVRLAIHPDDPPWSIFDIPRIISTPDDLSRLFEAVPHPSNGLTFCTGSFGARADNDLPAMIARFSDRIHFIHLRNVHRTGERDFYETAHPSGDVNMAEIIHTLLNCGVDAPLRPDHGRMIWGETGRAGYGLYDRALGAMYLAGLIEGSVR
jgi:mannonate dehydratase